MTFVAVTKILKVCTAAVILKGCSSATRRKQCHGKIWYKDTRHQIVPVQVEGQPEMDTQSSKEVSSSPTPERKENTEPCPVRMMIDIRMTNGIRIQQRNLTYRNLKRLIDYFHRHV